MKKPLQTDGAAIPGVQRRLLCLIEHLPANREGDSVSDHFTNKTEFVSVIAGSVMPLSNVNDIRLRDRLP